MHLFGFFQEHITSLFCLNFPLYPIIFKFSNHFHKTVSTDHNCVSFQKAEIKIIMSVSMVIQ